MEEKKTSSGCLKWTAIGCGVVAAMVVVGGIVLYFSFGAVARGLGSKLMVTGLESQLVEMGFPESEKQAILAPVKEFAESIRNKKVSAEQVGCVVEQVMDKRIVAAAMGRAFQVKYLEPSSLTSEEKTAARSDLQRFSKGILDGDIAERKRQEAFDVVLEPRPGASANSQKKRLKKTLTDEEVRTFVARMREAADSAKIGPLESEVDLASEIRKAIERGMKKEHLKPEQMFGAPRSGGVTTETLTPTAEKPGEQPS
jgi:flagellar basal body-associated protein FliL